MQYQQEELARAVTILTNTIHNCEKMQRKFAEGTSQHTLLKNRIIALNISKALLTNDRTMTFTVEELREALPPVVSIIHKTARAQNKYEEGSSQFKRFEPLIQAMLISKAFIERRIEALSELR
ncbi:hypothetical protein [Insulibacter thermoxylanivorax]|nr:hypothetical protein [Insulibacter thermoxylanivorax]